MFTTKDIHKRKAWTLLYTVIWSTLDQSTYFSTSKRIKDGTGRENYFDKKNV